MMGGMVVGARGVREKWSKEAMRYGETGEARRRLACHTRSDRMPTSQQMHSTSLKET